MATIITKNSSTASAVPSAGSLTQGELAVNVTDKKLYTKDNGGNVVVVGQEPLISGTNLKTVNSNSLLGSGNVAVQEVLVSGTNLKTVNSNSLLGSGNVSVQDVLVSGTNIKTVNGSSLLGSGNLTVSTPVSLLLSSRTSNTILGVADNGYLIDITSGTFTQTFDACATLASGWFVYIRNSGTGDITLDPNASETIDGLTSYIMYPGECRLIQCNGTALTSVVLDPFYKVFTSSGSFTKPPGYQRFEGLLWGGGGSGRKSGQPTYGGGGGACAPLQFAASVLGASETVTIGAGGTAQTTANTNGNAGGTSTFGGISAFGGSGGTSAQSAGGSAFITGLTYALSPVIGGGILTSNTEVTFYGGGARRDTFAGTNSGRTIYGGACGGSVDATNGNFGPSSTIYGGVGGAAGTTGSGTAGTAPGGGGGATETGAQSGAGASGELRIWGVV